VALVVDALLYRLVGFHVNTFFFRVALQRGALAETGVRTWQVAAFVLGGLAWVALEVLAFRALARRRIGPRRTWTWAAALVVACAVERLAVGALAFWGGPAVFAAGQVMPLQAPVRMNKFLGSVTGRMSSTVGVGVDLPDPFSGAAREATQRMPVGVDPAAIRFSRRPDVVFVVAESFRADFFDGPTMPRLVERARDGAVFEAHYASASNTYHGLFSLVFGLHPQHAEAVVGAGRGPILFGAMRENGYRVHFICASSTDWMGLKEGVFGGLQGELETDWDGRREDRDEEMMRRASRWVATVPAEEPLFLFLFFSGTHFEYFYPPRSAVFAPAWDGKGGSIGSTLVDPADVKRRARNAAHEVDWKLDELLTELESRRRRRPLVVFTGDHAEEFRDQGRMGHGSSVSAAQIHVPLVLLGDGVSAGSFDAPTSHVDVVPTLLALLGDTHDPSLYSDGQSAFSAPRDRFVLATVGWEPRYAAIGIDTKIAFSPLDVSLGQVKVTDPADRPVADAADRFARAAPVILRMLSARPGQAAHTRVAEHEGTGAWPR
jgi:membrane-anchored protein YejM (alkaline phosphatase superfamily)